MTDVWFTAFFDGTSDSMFDAAPRPPEQQGYTNVAFFPDDPKTFEVNFYPDGHVEAAITHWPSSPRIKLPEGRGEKP
jgi:hypothetical protein